MKFIVDVAEDIPWAYAALVFAAEAFRDHAGKGYNPAPASYSNKAYVVTVWPKVYEYCVIEVKLWKP